MAMVFVKAPGSTVALLAEGVDRNRAEWLERFKGVVALLAEGVDRNEKKTLSVSKSFRRPPRGGRG